ncbi:MAG: MFS transporter [Bacillota bacterium]|nr:MFS transporter [Bacillota bacterium]
MHPITPANNSAVQLQNSKGNWVLFFFAVFFFMVNLFSSMTIFPSYSLSIGSSPFQAGLQNTVFSLCAVLFRFFLGPVMDRQGPKPLMLVGVFTFATAPALLLVYPVYYVLLPVRIYQSLGLAVFLPGISTLLAEMAPPGKTGTYLGLMRIFYNLALLTGPSGALLVTERYSYETWFIISIITSAISLALLATVKAPSIRPAVEQVAGSLSQIKKAFTQKNIYPIVGGIILFSFIYSAVLSFAAVHMKTAVPELEAAYFFIIVGLTGIAACLTTGIVSDRLGRQKVIWPLLIILGLAAVGFYLLPFIPAIFIILAVLFGIAIQGSSLTLTAWLLDISKPGLRATTISIQENTIDIMFALSALVFGFAAQGQGLGTAFLVAGIVTIIVVFPLKRAAATSKQR